MHTILLFGHYLYLVAPLILMLFNIHSGTEIGGFPSILNQNSEPYWSAPGYLFGIYYHGDIVR